ncbi:MAG: D-glycerate dehydrogenase [Halioglobus sp.]|jgi:glyoxylate reductase
MIENVLVTARTVPQPMIGALEQFGEVRPCDADPGPDHLAGARVYVSTSVDPVPAEMIERFGPEMGLIANLGVGTDNIDLAAAGARGIQVSNTPVVTEDTADLTLALMLATCRRLSACERHLRAGDWAAGARILGQRVHGKTLGIVGFGAIGQAVARRAAGFGMQILYHGPHRKQEAEGGLDAAFCADLTQLLQASDIVSLNCPLIPETRHLINRDSLAQMKSGAVLINTGRGPLVDEAALVEALASGHLGGAGLDVFEFEPEVTPQLLAFDNVTLLPHIGSATGECRSDMAQRAIANIQAFLTAGAPLDRCV